MKVRELIATLETLNPDAKLYLDTRMKDAVTMLTHVDSTIGHTVVLRDYVLKDTTSVMLNGEEYVVSFRKVK